MRCSSAQLGDDGFDAPRVFAERQRSKGFNGGEQRLVECTTEESETQSLNALIGTQVQRDEIF